MFKFARSVTKKAKTILFQCLRGAQSCPFLRRVKLEKNGLQIARRRKKVRNKKVGTASKINPCIPSDVSVVKVLFKKFCSFHKNRGIITVALKMVCVTKTIKKFKLRGKNNYKCKQIGFPICRSRIFNE